MEFGSTMLHNVESLIRDERSGDFLLCRVPEPVRLGLNTKAQNNILFASNSEIRFVMEGDRVVLRLRRMPVGGSVRSQGILEVFQGDYQGSSEISPWSVTTDETEITIHRQDWSAIRRFAGEGYSFHPSVTRILLPYDWGCCLRDIKGDIRPPREQEMPAKCLLVYGSSITHGGNASVPSGTYPFRLARKLGYDLINLGCAGSCRMDDAMASYIGARDDWDMALFELGVNVMETWDGDRLYGRALAFLTAVLEARPDKQVFVTDMYYNRHDFDGDTRTALFRDAIQRCAAVLSGRYGERLHYINGLKAMDTPEGLSSDGIHPSDRGHEMIAERLAAYMAGYMAEIKQEV